MDWVSKNSHSNEAFVAYDPFGEGFLNELGVAYRKLERSQIILFKLLKLESAQIV